MYYLANLQVKKLTYNAPSNGAYAVDCSLSSGTTTTTCYDRACVSDAVIDCTNAGGCSTVCNVDAYYVPKSLSL